MNLKFYIELFCKTTFVSQCIFILVSCSGSNLTTSSQGNVVEENSNKEDYYHEAYIRYDNFIYKDYIKTVLLSQQGLEMSEPIIELNSGQKLLLEFDDLHGGSKDYYYAYIHCDADWKPSDISEMQYINGFSEDRIMNFGFSFNTIQKYTHYSVSFPNSNMMPTLSGNYVLLVFEDYDRKKIILTQRFMIVDFKLKVRGRCHIATLGSERKSRQELDFSIEHGGYPITNPMGDLKVVLLQNHNWNVHIRGLKPLFISQNVLDYSYDEENVFDGGNEFRQFDTRSLRLRTSFISEFRFDSSANHVYLLDDEVKANKQYQFENDINGRYVIRNTDGKNGYIDADYAWIHFSLPYPAPVTDGNIYVSGDLVNNNYEESAKMKYNPESGAYETAIFLKQGYYNYRYLFLKDGQTQADISKIEGNYSDTENDYTILVYHRPPGVRYDMLVGLKHLNSIKFN